MSILLQTVTYGTKCRQCICREMKDRHEWKAAKLQAVFETESKIWKHQECDGVAPVGLGGSASDS